MKLLLTSDTHYGMDGKTHNKHMKFWKKVSKVIQEQDIKALIWAGDVASFRQRHLYRSLEQAREFVDIPILLVRGNHDFWNGVDKKYPEMNPFTMDEIFIQHQEWFKKFNIHHLENGPYIIDDVVICGFDGWYAQVDPGTNDKKWMPMTIQGEAITSQYMVSKAWKDFDECLKIDTSKYRKSIIVTHHNPYPINGGSVKTCIEMGLNNYGHSGNFKFLLEMKEKFDILCCGHSHQYRNDDEEGIQIYNCGSDYNKPKYLIFEV